MTVHWYEGDEAFARKALKIGERGDRDTATLLGVTETEPVDFFIYADETSFYDALGPGTRENVGGQAHADIRTLFALITPDADRRPVGRDRRSRTSSSTSCSTPPSTNPYHIPPRWLNEGLAVYLTRGLRRRATEAAVADAVDDGTT